MRATTISPIRRCARIRTRRYAKGSTTARCSRAISTCGSGISAPARRWDSPKTALESFPVKVEGDSIYVVAQGALDAAELFIGISDATLAAIMALAQQEERAAGSICYDLGDPADDFFVLESGRVEFLIGRDERLSPAGFMLRKGEVFGWAALLDNHPQRIARATVPRTVPAACGSTASERSRSLENDPASGYLVMRRLSSLIARYLASSGSK